MQVTTINHKTVYRDRLEPYTCPENEFWTRFVADTPATWLGDPRAEAEFARLYGYSTLQVTKRELRVPEHMEAQYVAADGVTVYGGQQEKRDSGEIKVGTPPWVDAIIDNQLVIIDNQLTILDILERLKVKLL